MKTTDPEWRQYLVELNKGLGRHKFRMIQYDAELIMEVAAESELDARKVASLSFYPYILQAAMAAGDVPHDAQKQQSTFSGTTEPIADRPGYFRFIGAFRFVSDSPDWHVASQWLQDAVGSWDDSRVRVLAVERYRGFSGA